jgi:hypothetical protein
MDLKVKYLEIKGNCADLIMTDRLDHCVDMEDDCSFELCPRLDEFDDRTEEDPGGTCPTCNQFISSEDIVELRKSWRPYLSGLACGMLGCLSFILCLWLFLTVSPYKLILKFVLE